MQVIPSHSPDQLRTLWQRVVKLVTGVFTFVPEHREIARELKPIAEQALAVCGMQHVPALDNALVRKFHALVLRASGGEDLNRWLEMYGPGY